METRGKNGIVIRLAPQRGVKRLYLFSGLSVLKTGIIRLSRR
ncbi:MAG TPA: hypothetical protein VFV58_20600 [Blastocatellia bacterium]|jgi:hypothetical protein|nr:hypothetical protein [Blastocatellia bacterium]